MSLQDEYNKLSGTDSAGAINQMYDAMQQSQLGAMQQSHQQALSDQQAARDRIGGTFQTAANDLQVQYERNRRNLNQQAAANGLNTGAGSQQQLALQSVWNRDYGNLRGQEGQQIAEADRGIADLQAQQAAEENALRGQIDYQRAAALLDAQREDYSRRQEQAKTLASYGDFSLYAQIYGQEAADNMRSVWVASNPQLAYNTGAINADEYFRMTGKYPPNMAGSSGSGGWYRSPSTPPKTEDAGKAIDIDRAIYAMGTARADEAASVANHITKNYGDQLTNEQLLRLREAYEHATGTGRYEPKR